MAIKETDTIQDTSWAPFQYPLYRMMWIVSVISAVGTWMQDVGSAWLMATLSSDPLKVASIQAITTFAMFLFALPAGALADIIDRRKYLIVLQAGLMIAAGILAIITFLGKATPLLLLFMTFCLGTGAALSFPAWVALMSELVPVKHLPAAVVLNGVSINISRAIGPAIAGFIIAGFGPAAVFALNSISFFGIIIVLKRWRHKVSESALPAERLFGAIRAGIRYTWGSPAFKTVLIKTIGFFIFASGVWALLPLVVREKLRGGPVEFGLLIAFLGGGAVLGAMLLPSLRRRLNCDQLVLLGAMGFTITSLTLALSNHFYISALAMIIAGMSWTSALSTLSTLTQQIVSRWVKARAISIFFAAFFGSMSLGSFIWGGIGSHFSIEFSLVCAGIGLFLTNFMTYYLIPAENLLLDQTPSGLSPAPIVGDSLRYEEGPVMVLVEYTVDEEHIPDFKRAIRHLRRIRLRDGAFFWSLFKDINNPTKLVECFMVESWLEHLRQHERMSVSDSDIQAKVYSFNKGKTRPKVTHFVAHNIKRD